MQLYSGVSGVDDLAAELAAAADVPAGQRPHKGHGFRGYGRVSGGRTARGCEEEIGWRGRWRVATNTPDREELDNGAPQASFSERFVGCSSIPSNLWIFLPPKAFTV
eukprot:scaffold19903_cov64-Phaeocystis_antarctica.AAC.7